MDQIHSNDYIIKISDAAQGYGYTGCTLILIKQARQQFIHSRVFKLSGDESTQARESTSVVCDKYVRLSQSKQVTAIRLYQPKVCSVTVRREVYSQKLTILRKGWNIKTWATEKLIPSC